MTELFVIAACILMNALLAATEMAFVTADRAALRGIAEKDNQSAAKILQLRRVPERTLSVIQVGITLVAVLAAAVGGAGAMEWVHPYFERSLGIGQGTAEAISVALVVLPLTYLNVVIGELVPKSLAIRDPIKIILRAARWLALFDRILSPLVSALEWSTNKFLLLLNPRRREHPPVTSDAVDLESLSHQARTYVLNLANIERRSIRDVYLPWEHVTSVEVEQSMDEVEAKILTSGHTRVPVIMGNSVIGILNAKEFMAFQKAGENRWQGIVRSHVSVRVSDPLLPALRRMQTKRSHLSIVYAGNQRVGIVTMDVVRALPWRRTALNFDLEPADVLV